MSWGMIAVAGASLVGGVMASNSASDAAGQAAGAQTAASQAQIAESQRQFDEIQKLLSPYVDAGTTGLTGQMNLLGANGNKAQQQAINGIANGAQYNTLLKQGENAMLQNASATGGLRGGNLQGSLAQYRPQLLNQLINQQYDRYGAMTTLGQNSAAGVGTAGQNSSGQIINALGQQGAAQAGNALAQGQAGASLGNGIASAGGLLGSYLMKSPSSVQQTPAQQMNGYYANNFNSE